LVAVAGFSSTAAAQQLTTLYSFTGSGAGDGANPEAGLIADPAGNLYGTTHSGGDGGYGTVFRLDPSGTLTVLHNFTGDSDGRYPDGGLIADAAGNLYGTTRGELSPPPGCTRDCGTVFQLTPSGDLNVLHSFTGGSDGGTPVAGLIADEAGNLYGTTSAGGDRTNCAAQFIDGCGTVFQLDPSGTLNVLYNFTGGSDGGNPDAALIADAAGNLYGTTYGGGTGTGCIGGGACGTVFELTVSASFIGGRARRNMNTKRLGQAVPRMGHP